MTGAGRWFDQARFGMFVHWDHASQQGLEVSWPLVGGVFALPQSQSVTVEQYHSSAATFDPQEWDPVALARLARRAGMGYAVLTAKHHSGYAMWPTKLSDWSVARSPYGKDIVAGFVEAMRAEGLRVGLYFSLSDWHHPDYPAFTEEHKPYRFGASPPMPDPATWERYLEFMFGQVTELLTGYGDIDLLWFDGGWERPDWRAAELEAEIRRLQPSIILNDRLPGVGDYSTPEQAVPHAPPSRPWETCLTMNRSWGWNPDDHAYKSSRSLVHTLCEVAGKGGNLLLNVSPRGDGSLPEEQVARLEEIGGWMEHNAESIGGTGPGVDAAQFYGPSTRAGDTLYLHLLMRPYDTVDVRHLPVRRVRSVRELASGRPLAYRTHTGILEGLMADPPGTVTIEVPGDVVGELATVLAVELAPAG
ncbi:MAG TPA: alpha-L-fucosidase [Acidimicrobiales bacterium]|nr:alpha-L-fucosidase [Acidimicrobiales bacterium]